MKKDMLALWRSITLRWGLLFLIISLVRFVPDLFKGIYDTGELIRYGLAFAFAVVWHLFLPPRSKEQEGIT